MGYFFLFAKIEKKLNVKQGKIVLIDNSKRGIASMWVKVAGLRQDVLKVKLQSTLKCNLLFTTIVSLFYYQLN